MLPDPTDFAPASTLECTNCHEVKDTAAFGRDVRTATGYKLWCRDCCNKYQKERRRATSAESLIEAALNLVHPVLPDDRMKIDFTQIEFISGASTKEVRLHVMRKLQERENQKLAELRAKNAAEFAEKQADKAAIAAADEAIRSKRV